MSENTFVETPADKRSLSLRKPVFGRGINDADYKTNTIINGIKKRCPYYLVWKGMLYRCYDKTYLSRFPTYYKCEVANEWLVFSAFKKWMSSQDWQGMELDKDIKIIGNKTYNPDACLFVSSKVNKLFLSASASRGEFPIGVNFNKKRNRFKSQCRHNGRQILLGHFKNPEDASIAYKEFKNKVIIEAANQPENAYIKQYLLSHAKHLLGKAL